MSTPKRSGEVIVKDVLGLKPDEKFLVFTDKSKLLIGKAIYNAALRIVKNGNGYAKLVIVDGDSNDLKKGYLTSKSFDSPVPLKLTDKLRRECYKADAVLYAISGDETVTGPVRHFWMDTYSSAAKKSMLKSGKAGRCVGMPGITKSMFTRLVDVDYEKLSELGKRIIETLDKKKITVKTALGTDVSFKLNHKYVAYWDEKTGASVDDGNVKEVGKIGNIPAGEAFWEPVDYKTFNGTIVVDGAFGKLETGPLKLPVKYEVKKGIVDLDSITAINPKTKKEMGLKGPAKWLREFVSAHEDARVMYEFGVGTNPNAEAKKGTNLLELEKRIGSVHFATGAENHNDGLVYNPRIYANGELVLEGKVGRMWVWNNIESLFF